MKKKKTALVVFACIALLLAVGLAACSSNLEYGGDPVEFEHFKIAEQGTSAEIDVYEATKTENGVLLEHYLSYGGDDEEKNIIFSIDGDEALYDELCELLGNCRVDKWDGFHGTNSNVLDGSSMTFEATLSDGTTISASGSNKFPSNYGTLTETLYSLTNDK